MRSVTRHTLHILLALACLLDSRLAASSGDFIFHQSAASEPLLQKTTTALATGDEGELWIGTQEGLHVFTGVATRSYYYSDSAVHGLASDYITSFAESNDGDMIVGTRDAGAFKYNKTLDYFEALDETPDLEKSLGGSGVFALHVDNDNRLWRGEDNGFSVARLDNTDIKGVANSKTVSGIGLVNGFVQAANGLWAVSSAAGIVRVDTNGNIKDRISLFKLFGNTDTSIEATGINIDSLGRLWVWSLQQGISIVDPITGSVVSRLFQPADRSQAGVTVLAMEEVREGTYWIATAEGLFTLEEGDGEVQFVNSDILTAGTPSILSLAVSPNGTIWLGTLYGPISATPRLFESISTLTTSISSDSINAIAEWNDGIWLGTESGLNYVNGSGESIATFNDLTIPRLSDATVMALFPEAEGLWIGTYKGGLNYLQHADQSVVSYTNDPSDDESLSANGVTSILRTRRGNLLVGTYGGGLNILDEESGTFTRLQATGVTSGELSDNRVITMYQCSLGNIYVGTENGLNIFDEETGEFQSVFADETSGLRSSFVWAMHEDSDGDLWIGSYRGGVSIWRKKDRSSGVLRFEEPPITTATTMNTVIGIAEDDAGFIWLSHNGGLTRISKDYSYRRSFDLFDGLTDTEFNVGSTVTGPSGSIYFGGNRGVNLVTARTLPAATEGPSVAVSEIRVMNERVPLPSVSNESELPTLKLGYDDTLVEISFFANELANPNSVSYAYMMEGVSSDWIRGKDRHTASFTTLPSGNYVFRMAASNGSGIWNYDSASFRIVVSPPPWKSTTAYAVYIALFMLVISAIVLSIYAKAQRQEARRRELEEMVMLRTSELEEATKVAENANRAKSQFLATMSHELRTPMHGILGMMDLLKRTRLSEQQQQYTLNALNSGRALLTIINDILDYSKLEASKAVANKDWATLNTTIGDICRLQATTIQNDFVSLVFNPLPLQVGTVFCDAAKLAQCVTNLVGNSIKFTQKGNVTVTLTAEKDAKSSTELLVIQVSDDGVGMSEAEQSRVFDLFTQGDASPTREHGGTGLGLSITKQFIELMEGSVNLESERGQGTSVTLRIPVEFRASETELENDERSVCIATERSEVAASLKANCDAIGAFYIDAQLSKEPISGTVDVLVFSDSQKERVASINAEQRLLISNSKNHRVGVLTLPIVPSDLERAIRKVTSHGSQHEEQNHFKSYKGLSALVAEDISLNQKIAQEMLVSLGITVEIASDGEIAVEKFRSGNFDLVFMDCQMPKLDGYNAAKKIRELEAARTDQHRRTAIIALTAGTQEDDTRRCYECGMDSVLYKPFALDDIIDVVEQHGHIATISNERVKSTVSDFPASKSTQTILNQSIEEVLDLDVFKNLALIAPEDSRTFFDTLLNGFEEQFREQLTNYKEASSQVDHEAARMSAHALKSLALNVGAIKIAKLFANEEVLWKSGESARDSDASEIATDLLETYLVAVREKVIHGSTTPFERSKRS